MMHGQKNIKLKHDVFDKNCFIILVLNFNTSGFLLSKPTYTHSEYVTFIAFPQQQWLHDRASLVRYTYRCLFCLYVFTCWTVPLQEPPVALFFLSLASFAFIAIIILLLRHSHTYFVLWVCPLRISYLLSSLFLYVFVLSPYISTFLILTFRIIAPFFVTVVLFCVVHFGFSYSLHQDIFSA